MKKSLRFLVRLAAFAAVLFAAFLLIRIMRAPGTQGLLTWNPSYMSIVYAIVGLGLVPFLLAVLYETLHRIPAFRWSRAAGWVSLSVSVLLGAASLSALAYISIAPTLVERPLPAPRLLDPARGIAPRSAPNGGPYLRLAFSSDPHWGRAESDAEARTRTLKTVNAGGYDAFFILGDIAEMGFPEQGLREAAADLERFVPDLPVRPMLGNHDALVNGAGRWKAYFFPEGQSSDSGSPFYYRVDAGRAHILVLNLLWGEEDFDAEQRAWLTAQLKSIPREDAVLALSHCYYYASGYNDPETGSPWYDHPGTIREVTPLLEDYGVDLALSGHNHYMELLEHNGVNYAVIGALGGIPDPEPSYHSPASKWMKTSTFGFLEVEFYPERLDLTFRDSYGAALHRASIPSE